MGSCIHVHVFLALCAGMVDAWIRILISHLCIAFGLLIVSFQWMTSLSRPVKGCARVAVGASARTRPRLQYFGRHRPGLVTHWKGEHSTHYASVHPKASCTSREKSRKSDAGHASTYKPPRSIIRMNESRQTITEPTLTQLRVSLGIYRRNSTRTGCNYFIRYPFE